MIFLLVVFDKLLQKGDELRKELACLKACQKKEKEKQKGNRSGPEAWGLAVTVGDCFSQDQ